MATIVTQEQEIDLQNLITQLLPILIDKINRYHEMFELPLIAEQWEEVLHRSILAIGQPTTWTPNRSHTVGEDMRLINIPNSRISCKSGVLNKNCVKFSGSRSTRFQTLDEKIEHFSANHDDYYFLLSKHQNFDHTYKLLVFPSALCRVNQLTWTESASGKAWNGVGPFVATISQAMSGQLWTTLPLDLIPYNFDINIHRE